MLKRQRNAQSGMALGPILFIIAILALIAAAIAAGSGAFNGNTNTENVKSLAETIINQSEQVAMAVQKVRIDNGCDDLSPTTSALNFQNSVVSGYTNPNAPADGSCNVFDPRGGGLIWQTAPAAAIAGNNPSYGTDYLYEGWLNFQNIGSSCGTGACNDLAMLLADLTSNVCSQINVIVANNASIPISETWGGVGGKFAGTFQSGWAAQSTLNFPSPSFLTGTQMGCFQQMSANNYIFFRILQAR